MHIMTSRLIRDWAAFVAVAETHSFSCPAKALRCSASSVSKSVSRLEEEFGVILLRRSSREVEVTAAGQLLCKGAKEILQVYQALHSEFSDQDSQIKGSLRFAAPSVLCENVAGRWVYEYLQSHPGVRVSLQARDNTGTFPPEFDDLVLTGSVPAGGDFIQHLLGTVKFVLCATPDYLARQESIMTPDDLLCHRLLKADHPFLAPPLTFTRRGVSAEFSTGDHVSLVSGSLSSLLRMTLAGCGVSLALPAWLVSGYLSNGRLVQVLPDWQLPEMPVYLVWRYRKRYSRLFYDFKKYTEERWVSLMMQGLLPSGQVSLTHSDE